MTAIRRRRLLGGLGAALVFAGRAMAAPAATSVWTRPADWPLPLSAGQDTLAAWHSKTRADTPGLLKIAMTGDSTFDYAHEGNLVYASPAFKAKFQNVYGDGGIGWIPANLKYCFDGPRGVISPISKDPRAGWVLYDASENRDDETVAPYGCSPDLTALYTTSATATLRLRGLACTRFRVFYDNSGGGTAEVVIDKKRYRIVCDRSASVGVLDIALADVPHAVNLATAGNTGRVCIYGFCAEYGRGAVIHKLANAGTDCNQFARNYDNPAVVEILRHLDIDLHLFSLGTNCCRRSHTPPGNFAMALDRFIAVTRRATPACGHILSSMGQFYVIGDPESHVIYDGRAYVEETYKAALRHRTAFLNWWELTGDYASAYARGLWQKDHVHPTLKAGKAWVDAHFSHFNL